jgi:2-hydroxychromene-2-carboxylate isomerase
MPEPIAFYFDFASPYGYLASTQIDSLAEKHDRQVDWRPIMLGAAMKVTGAQPLVQIPMRGDYSRRDMPRFARYLGVPFKFPPVMPILTLAAARAVYWCRDRDPGLAHRLAKALYHAHFGEGLDIAQPEQVADIAQNLDIDPQDLLDAVQSPEVKARLKAETGAALEAGIFGSPFFIVDGEPFWGADRLGQLDRWLETGGF